MSAKTKRGPGRPRVFTPAQRRRISKFLRAFGLTKGVAMVYQLHGIKVSIPTAKVIANEYGVTFTQGRPKS